MWCFVLLLNLRFFFCSANEHVNRSRRQDNRRGKINKTFLNWHYVAISTIHIKACWDDGTRLLMYRIYTFYMVNGIDIWWHFSLLFNCVCVILFLSVEQPLFHENIQNGERKTLVPQLFFHFIYFLLTYLIQVTFHIPVKHTEKFWLMNV